MMSSSVFQLFYAGIRKYNQNMKRPLMFLRNIVGIIVPALKGYVNDNYKYAMSPLIFLLATCSLEQTSNLPTMNLDPGSEREIAYTDKSDAFWVTRTGGYNSSPWHGLTASKRSYLEDIFIFADGVLLPREQAEIEVNPVSLTRRYVDQGITETWTLIDDSRSLNIQIESQEQVSLVVQPAIMGGNKAADFVFSQNDQYLDITLNQYKSLKSAYPNVKITFSEPVEWGIAKNPETTLYTAFLTSSASLKDIKSLSISVSLAKDYESQPDWDKQTLTNAIKSRTNRIEHDLVQVNLKSTSSQLNQAIAWAHTSIDALVMDQLGMGIYAGLPWFDDYWGRDAFISFTGAVLVSGRFDEARRILLSFAELQNIDPEDANYGRVPNRAQPEDIIYNTTDGTPWFIRSIWDYYRYTGDLDFMDQLWPSVRHAFIGASQNWTDEAGLLRHADADTWMDARGPDGAWSPRGDRGIDIQFIWRDQLEITRHLAELKGDIKIQKAADNLLLKLQEGLKQFRSKDGAYLVDHLNADGSQDEQIRPNIFLVPPLFGETCDWPSFKHLAPQLITHNGVLSLSQTDSNFHPYHHLPGLYVQDAAYHNGIIWTWNSAATITQAIRFHQYNYAQALFDDLTDQILNRGAVGTIAELTDAWPRSGENQLSGTFTQAWSVAEYLRSFYQDILGIQPNLTQSQVRIAPRLLKGMEQVDFRVPIGDDHWDIKYDESLTSLDIHIERSNSRALELSLGVRHLATISNLELSWDQLSIHLRYEKQMGQWTVPGDIVDYTVMPESIDISVNSLPLCPLDTTREVPVLKGPDHRLLDESEVVKSFENGTEIFYKQDPQGDDRGDHNLYTYPSNPQFAQGIVDIRSARIFENATEYHFEFAFKHLIDPGWHPEYGYQLTYLSLGVSYDSKSGSAQVGKNSQTLFKHGFKADQIMYVSGGILLVDNKHVPELEYIPKSPAGAIGVVNTGMVSFTLPKNAFDDDLKQAIFQIAVGCQDDHGGAGIGDFRDVQAIGSEWNGGGKENPDDSNVYDWLFF